LTSERKQRITMQQADAVQLDAAIAANLKELEYGE
jgi:hypothetical protein